jgi:transcriptional regulator GlxA family with amidase domain
MHSIVLDADLIVGLGTGSFLMAAAGLIDGRDVLSHPSRAGELAAVAPSARVHSSVGIMRDGNLVSVTSEYSAVAACRALFEPDPCLRREGIYALDEPGLVHAMLNKPG